jgi:multidrug transporter EmrE-like cation transporter
MSKQFIMTYNYLILFLSIFLSAFGQVFQKKATFYQIASLPNILFILLSSSFYLISFGTFYLALKNLPLSKASPILTIGSTILIVILSILFFSEIIRPKHILGIFLGFLAIWLIASN